MSTPSIVTSFYDRIWNAGDLNAADELLANHFVFRGSLGVELRGREPFKDYASAVLQALGNYRCEILDCVTEQDRAFAKMRFGGIHRGVFRGFEPTGKPVQWHGAALFRIENGVIGELWVLGDLAGLDAMLKENANSASSTPPQELSSILRTSSTDPAQN